MGNLEVVISPDILNDNESAEGGVAVEGGSVRLRCHATGVPEPAVTWRREDTRNIVLRHEGGREKQAVRFFDGDTIVFTNIQRSDMGSYLCIASNGVPPSVSKRFMVKVHFHPLIRVSNQLVAAPIASDVQVQCYVEASPRAMNHWTRDSGEKLMPNEKYLMEETVLNDYSLLMNLTIRSLEKKDFGGYLCMSSNALGKAEGVVRLQGIFTNLIHIPYIQSISTNDLFQIELHLVVQTTSTANPPRYVDTKPRKPPHKDKGKKYIRQKGRKNLGEIGETSDEDVEMTTVAIPDSKRVSPETTYPSPSRPPSRVPQQNGAAGSTLSGLIILTVVLPTLN